MIKSKSNFHDLQQDKNIMKNKELQYVKKSGTCLL
jgi:hypothetical protein